jgi:hypothetical protein
MKIPFLYEIQTVHIIAENMIERGKTVKIFALTYYRAMKHVLDQCSDDESVSEITSWRFHRNFLRLYQPANEE